MFSPEQQKLIDSLRKLTPDEMVEAERKRNAIENLRKSTQELHDLIVTLPSNTTVFKQFWDGAITLAEFNLRSLEYSTLVNELGRQLDELVAWEGR